MHLFSSINPQVSVFNLIQTRKLVNELYSMEKSFHPCVPSCLTRLDSLACANTSTPFLDIYMSKCFFKVATVPTSTRDVRIS